MCGSARLEPRQAVLNVIAGRTLMSCGGQVQHILVCEQVADRRSHGVQGYASTASRATWAWVGMGRYPIVTEARNKALENARAFAQGSEPRDRSRVPAFKQTATGTRSAGSGRRSRSASGSSGARPTWTASERSGPWRTPRAARTCQRHRRCRPGCAELGQLLRTVTQGEGCRRAAGTSSNRSAPLCAVWRAPPAEGLTETGTNAYGMVRLQRGRRRLSMV